MAYQTKYFELEKEFKEHYGDEIIVLKETGMFYEIFEKDQGSEKLLKISKILGLSIVKSRGLGIHRGSKDKYVKILINEGYVVIIIDNNWKEEQIYLQG